MDTTTHGSHSDLYSTMMKQMHLILIVNKSIPRNSNLCDVWWTLILKLIYSFIQIFIHSQPVVVMGDYCRYGRCRDCWCIIQKWNKWKNHIYTWKKWRTHKTYRIFFTTFYISIIYISIYTTILSPCNQFPMKFVSVAVIPSPLQWNIGTSKTHWCIYFMEGHSC